MISDERAKKLAELVLSYSVSINKNDILLMRGEQAFKDFAEIIGNMAEQKGAKVIYHLIDLKKEKDMIKRSNDSELEEESKKLCSIAERITATIRIDAEEDPFYLQDIDPEKIAKYKKIVIKPLLDRLIGDGKNFKTKKWNLVAYPCEAQAKNADMTLEEYTDFVYNAMLIDWKKMADVVEQVKNVFDDAEDVHMQVPGMTNFRLSLKGRGGGISKGINNMPGGEVYYGVVEDSAQGNIYFPYQSLRDGNLVGGIKIIYMNGEVIAYDAKKNMGFFKAMIELEGAKRIGELGIGCNYGIKKYTKNLLFDEKMGGTMHIALGMSYKKDLRSGGGLNDSDIHWDLVCDLRKSSDNPGGSIHVDGKLVQENGVWVF